VNGMKTYHTRRIIHKLLPLLDAVGLRNTRRYNTIERWNTQLLLRIHALLLLAINTNLGFRL
jgi:hypothetical protein